MMMTMKMTDDAEKSSRIEIIRTKLEEWGFLPYIFQPFNKPDPKDWDSWCRQEFITREEIWFEKRCKPYESFQFSIEPVTFGKVKPCSYSQLQEITDFNTDKFIQKTLSGRLFRGTIGDRFYRRPVLVKTWDFLRRDRLKDPAARVSKFTDELELFTDEKANIHPNLVKLCRYCCERRLAVVYDETSTGFLSNALMSVDFGWDKRINVATQLADLFVWLHDKSIAVGCVTVDCILIDEEKKNIKVFDFGFVSNHVNEGSEIPVISNSGWDAPEAWAPGTRTMKSDVYIFGCILLELISKEHDWTSRRSSIETMAKRSARHLVHESFTEVDLCTTLDISILTLRCTSSNPEKRPTMKEVHEALTGLGKSGLPVENDKRNENELLLLQEVCEWT